MEFRLLESFVAVAETGSVTAAARRLRIAQPSLSQQMRTLERAVGADLLVRERGSRGVTLTPAGRTLLTEGRALLDHRARTLDAVRAARDAAPTPIRLGLVLGVAPALVAQVVDAIDAAVPTVRVVLADPQLTSANRDLLLSGELSLAMVRLHGDLAGLATMSLRTQRMGAWLPPDDPLLAASAPDAAIPIEALDGRAVYRSAREVLPAFWDEMMAAFDRAGVTPQWVQIQLSVASLYLLALARTALPLGPAQMPLDTGDLVWREVAGLPRLTTGLGWRPDPPAHVRACVAAVSEMVDAAAPVS